MQLISIYTYEYIYICIYIKQTPLKLTTTNDLYNRTVNLHSRNFIYEKETYI